MKNIIVHECEVCKKQFEALIYEDDVFSKDNDEHIAEICEVCYYKREAKEEKEERIFCPYVYKVKGV